ncbi:hypothetical protein N9955_00040 [bacterium]|nr:hypothetical protein [bacterium]
MLQRQAKQQVNRIKQSPRRILDQIVNQWEQEFDNMWQDDGSVEYRLEALGTDAEELLDRSAALVTFILGELSGEDEDLVDHIEAKISSIPAYTIAADGSVTLD